MNITKIIFVLSASLSLLGGAVTTPDFNSAELDLPAAIANEPISSVIARIGTVVAIQESDNITVALSGSPTLVTASYLFPQYQPLLGDRVYITKQDAQWAVLGTLSGPLNTLAENASFEDGTISTTPDDWTVTPIVTTAGTPTFRKESFSSLSGNFIGVFRNSSAGTPGAASADIFSTIVPAEEFQKWALGFYLPYAAPDLNASLESQGGFMDLTGYIQFLDGSSTLISEAFATYTPIYAGFISPVYIRTFTASGATFLQAPAGTNFVRIRFRVTFTMHVNSASELGIDAVLFRHG